MASSTINQLNFKEVIKEILGSWTALQLAVGHGCGGLYSAEKLEWMPHAISTWFQENSELNNEEVEDFLAEILDHEFNTVIQDMSLSFVSRLLCACYISCQAGRYDEVRSRLTALPKPPPSSIHQLQVEDDSTDDEVDSSLPVCDSLDSGHSGGDCRPSTQHTDDGSPGEKHITDYNDSNSMEVDGDDGWTQVNNRKNKINSNHV